MEAWKPIYRCGEQDFDQRKRVRSALGASAPWKQWENSTGDSLLFCSYAGHVWKHGNLSTDAGSRISTGGKGCAPALGARHHRYGRMAAIRENSTGDCPLFFCSYAGHVWKHGNLSTGRGEQAFRPRKGALRRSLGTMGIYGTIGIYSK